MDKRPEFDKTLDEKTFRSYYYLKEELAAFCRANGLPASGSKMELTERIAEYLSTGEIKAAKTANRVKKEITQISEESLIEPDFVCSEKHRAFFKERVGNSFSFNVPFQKWLKANAGKTYAEAVEAYHKILAEKKSRPVEIESQFEYNIYIRAFLRIILINPYSRQFNAGIIRNQCPAAIRTSSLTCLHWNDKFVKNKTVAPLMRTPE